MNYFEFYEIRPSFHPDAAVVKRKFYELSKRYHPDFYVTEPEEKQQEILELSTLNNKAYQVLSDERKRVAYVLEQSGLLTDGDKHRLPPDFLMEMMEINEALMELEMDPDAGKLAEIRSQTAAIDAQLGDDLAKLTREYDASPQPALLDSVKDVYFRQKYLLRIKESLGRVG